MVEGCCHMKLDLAPLLRLYADGQYPSLVEQVDLALAKFPETFELYNVKGAALAAMSRTDDSLNSYKKALKINRKSAETHNNLAAVLQDKGDIQAAIRHHKTALRLNPNFAYDVLVVRGHRSPAFGVLYPATTQCCSPVG